MQCGMIEWSTISDIDVVCTVDDPTIGYSFNVIIDPGLGLKLSIILYKQATVCLKEW